MKQVILVLLCTVFLCGCGAPGTVETVEDSLTEPMAAMQKSIQVELPGEAAVPTMESDQRRYYICNDYEISLETFPSGDVEKDIETISGFPSRDLTVVKTEDQDIKRYDFVWSSQGETGQRLGRASILDDGNYLYTLSVLRDAESAENSQVVWRTVFESFSLS